MLLKPEPLSEEQYEAQSMARRENQQIIEKYLSLKGSDPIDDKMALFADDIMYEIVNTMACKPERTCGKKNLRQRFESNARMWKEFEYNNIRIIPTDRKETFLVECDADGTIFSPMFKEPRSYHNYYYIMFVLRNKKIWQLRQFTNPMKLIHDFWKKLPDDVG
ncbi:MAG: PhzA/PhzB family protein [Clostridiales bacterium]|nr:PhzA/PhzB family protein [Clostridiales bacterium]